MKILFIASRFPHPPFQGDRLRGSRQLRGLSHKHEFVLVTPPPDGGEEEAGWDAVRPHCARVEVVNSPSWKRLSRLGRAPFTKMPFQTLYSFDPRLCRTVCRLLSEERFDLVHVQLVRMAPIVAALGDIPKVIDLIDALSLNWSRRAQRERGLKRGIANVEARRIQHYERALLPQYNRLIVSSPVDREAIGEAAHLHVIPNGVDIECWPFARAGREPATLIFTGRMSYYPNVDAATWFACEVLPRIRRRVPQAQLLIVGAEPAPAVERLSRMEGVTVTGRVPNLHDYLTRATVAVAPMRSGSGMQLKVLEAMASGTPIVATPFALGGMDGVKEEHLLIAEDATTFAADVVRLLESPALAERIAANARELVESCYTWDRSVEMLEQVYELAQGNG